MNFAGHIAGSAEPYLQDFFQILGVGDDGFGPAVEQAVFQGLRTEEGK